MEGRGTWPVAAAVSRRGRFVLVCSFGVGSPCDADGSAAGQAADEGSLQDAVERMAAHLLEAHGLPPTLGREAARAALQRAARGMWETDPVLSRRMRELAAKEGIG